jgi:hypothetical protein
MTTPGKIYNAFSLLLLLGLSGLVTVANIPEKKKKGSNRK